MNIKERFFHIFQKIVVPLGYIVGVGGLVLAFARWPDNTKIIVFVVILTVTFILTGCLTCFNLNREKQYAKLSDQNIIARQLKTAMNTWYKEERYGEVVTFGKAIGRALYISACYETRIEIGEIVKKAAEHIDDDLLLVNVLLDDMGWTKVLCGKTDAKQNIEQGLRIAQDKKYYKEISKGYRHLMAIALTDNDTENANAYLQKAYDAYNSMENGREKEIVLSGLFFSSSELAYKSRDYTKAMEMAKKSEDKRKETNAIDRHMRFYAQIGKIELNKPNGNIKTARKYFGEGIDESESINRIDELVKNAYGYAICCIKLNEKKKVKQRVGKILKEYGNIPLYSEDELLRKEYNSLISQ